MRAEEEVKRVERVVKIYEDHLARDRDNFGTGIYCHIAKEAPTNSWTFTKFNATIPVKNTWNCHGGSKHAYDGSGNGYYLGSSHFYDAWDTVEVDETDELEYPFSEDVITAINAMSSGDVVSYHCTAKDATIGPGHTATSVEGATTWGANNAAMVYNAGAGKWEESWKFGQTSVQNCAADLSAHWPSAFTGWTLDYIKIHKRPED